MAKVEWRTINSCTINLFKCGLLEIQGNPTKSNQIRLDPTATEVKAQLVQAAVSRPFAPSPGLPKPTVPSLPINHQLPSSLIRLNPTESNQ